MLDMPGPELSPATFVVLLENSKALGGMDLTWINSK
jgi:hypothetical protein